MAKQSIGEKKQYLAWQIGQILTVGSILVLVPLAISLPHTETIGETVLGWTVSIMFLIDTILYRKEKRPAWRRSLEFVSVVPFIPVANLILGQHWLVPFIAVLHLVRVPVILARIKAHKEALAFAKFHKMGSILFFFVLMVHGVACGWIGINGLKGEEAWTAYVKAVYWSVTTLGTIGYGDIVPTDNLGRFYAMGVMVVGVGIFGFIIGQVSRLITAGDKREETNRAKLEHLENFLRHYDVPKDVRHRVFKFYKHLIGQHTSEEERKILSELPPALQGELQIYMNIKPISKLRLFRGASHACLQDVAAHLDRVFYQPGGRIIKKGDTGHEMYVIGHGEVDVHDGDKHIAVLHDGQCVGEMSLIQDETRSADVTATSYCDLFVLTKEKFNEVLAAHEVLRRNVAEIMAERKRAA